MRYFVIFLVLITVSLLSINSAYGIWLPQSSQELLEESQVIVVGNITSVNVKEFQRSNSIENYTLTLDEYEVKVEEFVKNPQNTDTITVKQPTLSTPGRVLPFEGFAVGDRVLLYIKDFDGTNTYSKESFLIPKQCDSSSVIHEPRMIGSDYKMMQNGTERQDNFTANSPIQFMAQRDMDSLSGASIEYDVYISKQAEKTYKERVFHQTITADAKPCEWLSVARWEFTPDTGNYLLNGRVYKVMSNFSIENKFFSVFPQSPLKQFNSNVPYDEIQCKESLVLVLKYDGSPVCVKPETIPKLIERGWAKDDSWTAEYKNPTLEQECADSYIIMRDKLRFMQETEFVAASSYLMKLDEILEIKKTIHESECDSNSIQWIHLVVGDEKIANPSQFLIETSYGIVNKIINHELVMPRNAVSVKIAAELENRGIEYEIIPFNLSQTGEGWRDPTRLCSTLVFPNGTEFYASATFHPEPLNVTGIFTDLEKPKDCQKHFDLPRFDQEN